MPGDRESVSRWDRLRFRATREYTLPMSALVAYLRAHPWQRRMLTVGLTATVGALAAFLLRPHVADYILLRRLASKDPAVRSRAIGWGIERAEASERTRERLDAALNTEDDDTFLAVATVLSQVEAFRTPGRDPNQLDRLEWLGFLAARPASAPPIATQSASRATAPADANATTRPSVAVEIRRAILNEVTFAGRDGKYVRRLLTSASEDDSPVVRRESAILAARLADVETLQKLLKDPDPAVASWAAIDAGLADIAEMGKPIESLVWGAGGAANTDTRAGCAYALLRLDPNRYMMAIENVLDFAPDEGNDALRDRLYPMLLSVDNESIRKKMVESLTRDIMHDMSLSEFHRPSPRTLAGVGRLGGLGASDDILDVLCCVTGDANGLSQLQVLAASQAADLLKLPVRAEVDAIVRQLWRPEFSLTETIAVRVLGRQLDLPQGPDPRLGIKGIRPRPPRPGPVSKEQAVETLRLAALSAPPMEPNSTEVNLNMALPSAAAAVALWLHNPSASFLLPEPAGADANTEWAPARFDKKSAAYLVYQTSCSEHRLPADYIAWHLARSGRPEAFELGLNLLPPSPEANAPKGRRAWHNYSDNSRAAGAMLLALSARTPQQKEQARGRLHARLEGWTVGRGPGFFDRGTYQCALLILGETRFAGDVAGLLQGGAFPPRRALTALCAAGSRAGLDWLLWDPHAAPEETAFLLINTGAWEVLEAITPDLPTVDLCAGEDLLLWEVQIMQDYYRIHREELRFVRP